MSKRLPYYQFEPAEYRNGDIQLCSYAAQGVFVNLKSIYWIKGCILTLEQAKRMINSDDHIQELLSENIIKLEGDSIVIDFLDEQLLLITGQKKRLSDAGKKGAEAKKLKAKEQATHKPPLSEALTPLKQLDEIIGDEIKEDEIKEDEITVYPSEVNECFDNCLSCFPTHLHPKDSKEWVETIDKLNRIDKIPFNVIEDVVKKTRNDEFWSKQFLSLTKLRKLNKEGMKYIIVFNEKFKNNKDEKRIKLTEFNNQSRLENPNI